MSEDRCTICQQTFKGDDVFVPIITGPCGHSWHGNCIAVHMPMPCPVCRAWLTPENCIADEFIQWDGPSPDEMAMDDASVVAEQSVPMDVLPMCCCHMQPGGALHTSLRSMRYHAQEIFQSAGWPGGQRRFLDTWHCYGCSRDVSRPEVDSVINSTIGHHDRQCPQCGPKATVINMRTSPPALEGYVCFRPTDTYLQPVRCELLSPWDDSFLGGADVDVDVGIMDVASSDGSDVGGTDGMEDLRAMVQRHRDDDYRELQQLAAGWMA